MDTYSMMVLARRDDEWFLAAFAPHLQGCNLSAPTRPVHHADKFRKWNNRVWVQSHSPVDGITFYPEVRYRGMRFWPQHWDPESTEPMVVGFMPMNLDLAPTQQERDAIVKQLLDEGWSWSVWEGLARAVHVDELEKIEGPPPEGAF